MKNKFLFIQKKFRLTLNWLSERPAAIQLSLVKMRIFTLRKLYKNGHRFVSILVKHKEKVVGIFALALMGASVMLIPPLQDFVITKLGDTDGPSAIRSLLQTLAGAMLGATAIVSSLVLFSMQINVDRLPHGLFRHLSTDVRLLIAFASAFILAFLVGIMSLFANKELIGIAILSATWATLLILILFHYSYRRALVLINPLSQLKVVVDKSRRELKKWARRADQEASLLVEDKNSADVFDKYLSQRYDRGRIVFYQRNPQWSQNALQEVNYLISISRRYIEKGDYEISAAAMDALILINAAYIEAKGKTFFTNKFLIENPMTVDGFINTSLEHLRQSCRIAISRGDEQQINQILKTLAILASRYAQIDYSEQHASKFHAKLAATYLTNAIEQIVPHNMPDVLMNG